MRQIIIYVITPLLFYVNRVSGSDGKDLNVKIAWERGQSFICVTIYNDSGEDIYIPEIEALSGCIALYDSLNTKIDFSNEFRSQSKDAYPHSCSKSCMPNFPYKNFDDREKDSIYNEMMKKTFFLMRNNKQLRFDIIQIKLNDIALIRAGEIFTDVIWLDQSGLLKQKVFSIKYVHPFVIRTSKSGIIHCLGNTFLCRQKRFHRNTHYPEMINGYKLYDKSFSSEFIEINLEK